jgi:hypothetical protein
VTDIEPGVVGQHGAHPHQHGVHRRSPAVHRLPGRRPGDPPATIRGRQTAVRGLRELEGQVGTPACDHGQEPLELCRDGGAEPLPHDVGADHLDAPGPPATGRRPSPAGWDRRGRRPRGRPPPWRARPRRAGCGRGGRTVRGSRRPWHLEPASPAASRATTSACGPPAGAVAPSPTTRPHGRGRTRRPGWAPCGHGPSRRGRTARARWARSVAVQAVKGDRPRGPRGLVVGPSVERVGGPAGRRGTWRSASSPSRR